LGCCKSWHAQRTSACGYLLVCPADDQGLLTAEFVEYRMGVGQDASQGHSSVLGYRVCGACTAHGVRLTGACKYCVVIRKSKLTRHAASGCNGGVFRCPTYRVPTDEPCKSGVVYVQIELLKPTTHGWSILCCPSQYTRVYAAKPCQHCLGVFQITRMERTTV
jgi:hypothetical protein